MAAVAFTETALQNVKRGLRQSFPDRKSSHLTEALAAALGFRTHAALLDSLTRANHSDSDFVLLDDEAFIRRLFELDDDGEPQDEDLECFEVIGYPDKDAVIKTKSRAWYELSYALPRARAWRNLMVATVNAAIEQRIFTIRPGDNRWQRDRDGSGTKLFRFSVNGISGVGSVADIGYDELTIHGALWPTPRGEKIIHAYRAGFEAGEAVAYGHFERRDGAWLQYNGVPDLACRSSRLATVAGLAVDPLCYADRGDFKM